jgi:predicted AAA+ superfamily ATPase
MAENHILVSQGFRALLGAFAPYIARELQIEYGDRWWRSAVLDKLYDDQKRDLPAHGNWGELVDALDIQRCLLLFDLYWNDVFRKRLSIDHRTWAKELIGVRNKLAHIGGLDFSDDDTWRALDTMSRLCEQIDSESAEEIRAILRQARYGSANGSTAVLESAVSANVNQKSKSSGVLREIPLRGLPSWRDVIEPHPDVAQGRYKNAEFAADLAQVARGEGAYEYRDPVEFFARTYITEGMSGLLTQALKRVSGKDGEPVIQLKTAFGGGKTHSMLALYHLLRGKISVDKVPAAKPILASVGISSLPRVNVAVLVGTSLDPSKSRRPNNLPGITINTLWGELAAQLAESAGNLKLYNYVKEADKKGVSPGSEALKNLFDACAPCMVLIDELVAYAKKIYGVSGLPAGSFDNMISFVQEITEAARASKNSLIVASIPESDIEIGGEAGKRALETIEHTFGRMEAIWKPVAAGEGFEVVRRRLFLDCKSPAARDQVCSQFSQMYTENTADFPISARELEYKQRLISCYPIHPEIFDRLYEDWATLERFQKTRGVLRLMATVVHDLWMNNDAGLMIMPGSVSLDNPNVRDELTRHLPENWNSLVDSQVDGKNSEPYQKDQNNIRFGRVLACRRLARTILLGSAPSVREQAVRGIEASRIRLGVVQPGENIATFNDALNTLQTVLAYLYTNPSNDRFWYDTRPTLRKTVEDRASQILNPDVEFEIETRLRTIRKEAPFSGIHICPSSSLDVPDDQSARLVILQPNDVFKASAEQNNAITAAENILNNRGQSPRIYRNMLAFIAPDADVILSLKNEVKRYLAWKSIKEDSEYLNLDAAQNRETKNGLDRSNETVDLRLKEAYCWLLVPYIDRSVDMKTILWDRIRITGGNESIVAKAAKKMMQNEALITKWAPVLLLMELDNILWKEIANISIKTLWDYLCTYCYLPRLSTYEVLEDAVRSGLNSPEYFALAEGVSDGRYLGLRFNQYVGVINRHCLLVKVAIAKTQIEQEANERTKAESQAGVIPDITYGSSTASGQLDGKETDSEYLTGTQRSAPGKQTVPEPPKNKRFFMSATLDNTRINRDVNRLVDEVISHLTAINGSKIEITLEVNAEIEGGVPTPTVRTVTENCRTLKVGNYGFEE